MEKPRPDIARAVLYAVVFIISLFLSGCISNSDDSSAGGSSNSSATKIDILLSSESVFLAQPGSQFQLTATLTGTNGVAFLEQPVFVWSTDGESIATVDQAGLITAKALGAANIFVTAEGINKKIPVLVSADTTTLKGKIRYEDKEYSASGFTGRIDFYKSVRFAKVDLIAADGTTVEQTTYTDADGKFSFSGILSSQQKISVQAITDESKGLQLRVEDRSSALYSVSKGVDLSSLDNFAMDISIANTAAGAFNILDVLTSAAQFTLLNSDATVVTLAAFWQPNNADGTYFCTGYDSLYCRQGAGIYVYNAVVGDSDEFDDDVLYHEFGHYFADALSRDDSLGGCHLLSSRDLDLRLAWSEGWGDFFPAAIKSWLQNDPALTHLLSSSSSLATTAYVDTYGTAAQIYIDLANMSQQRYSSAANEMAVAKILWALSEQFDIPAIVKVLSEYFPKLAYNQPVNLESFWDGWLAVHNPDADELQLLESIFAERLVFYQEDIYEADGVANLARKAVLGQSETHYLYSKTAAVDLDVVAFDAQANRQYTLQTSGLTGGADTYIRILDGSANPVANAENDDSNPDAYYGYDSVCGSSRVKNSATALASTVTFTAPATGIYYAEIRTTIDNEPYLSAGRYGTYDFKVSQN